MSVSPSRPSDRSRSAPRAVIGREVGDRLDPAEINALAARCGQPVRPEDRLAIALAHSYCCITARLLADGTLVGFVRAVSDGILNATLWDLWVDPRLPDPPSTKGQMLDRMLRELKRDIPGCSVSAFADPEDVELLQRLEFVVDPSGIRGMRFDA